MKIALEITAASAVRWILGLLLVWAAVSKIANLQEFYGTLIAYNLPLPGLILRAIAIVLPWAELICGLMLLARFQLDAALIWALMMFGSFVLATGQAWARGLNISCGCLDLSVIGIGTDSDTARLLKSASFAFVRALLLVAGGVYVWRAAKTADRERKPALPKTAAGSART